MTHMELCGMKQYYVTVIVDGKKRESQVGCNNIKQLRKELMEHADRVIIDPVMVG